MIRWLLFWNCQHRRTTFPQTPLRRAMHAPEETSVVCLDCGKRLGYSWEEMRITAEVAPPAGRKWNEREADA